jgi:hypothetical protein
MHQELYQSLRCEEVLGAKEVWIFLSQYLPQPHPLKSCYSAVVKLANVVVNILRHLIKVDWIHRRTSPVRKQCF